MRDKKQTVPPPYVENPKAFPGNFEYPGMSLRDWFAGQAVGAHAQALSPADLGSEEAWHDEVARLSYATADALLAERSRK